MANEKLQTLTKYQSELKNKLDTKELPAKHKSHGDTYRAFLNNELKAVSAKIEALKMAGGK